MATKGKPQTILRDPYYAQIISRLSAHLDDRIFERCVSDLLRRDLPGLVPVTGGGDQGFDGAIADGQGEPYQLVCTISADFSAIKRNLVQNLRAARHHNWPRRRAALVVSAALKPSERSKLFETARSEGFELVHLADRESLADHLYRDARWCRELLGLSGQPPALSRVPETARPYATATPVGREEILDWLRTTPGDRILWGQPGSGKTFLLRHLALQDVGLFLASDDKTATANELHENPEATAIFVDDAHLRPDRLDLLTRLREEIGHNFSIVVTSWPGDVDNVAARLGELPKQQLRELEPLTREEIVDVYRGFGVSEADPVMRLLVDQASNKPGLAATLAHAWLSGDKMDVLTGEALCRRVVDTIERRTDLDPTLPLAVLSLGGDGGMPVDAASNYLGESRLAFERELSTVLHAGILQQDRSQNVSVVPRDLRAALIRRRFFPTPGDVAKNIAVDWKRFLEDPTRLVDGVVELLRAAHRGAKVPRRDLEDLLLRADEQGSWRMLEAWRGYATLGRDEARWVLDRYPRDIVDIARETLAHAAEPTIEKLIERARGAGGLLHNQPGHPLRILNDWIQKPPDVHTTELVERRALVVSVAKRFLEQTNDREVAIHAMTLALDPGIHSITQDPGLGSRFSLGFAFLPMESIEPVARLWQDIRRSLEPIDSRTWWHLESVLRSWSHPETVAHGPVGEDRADAAKEFVTGVANDLLPAARGRPGLSRALARVASWVGLQLSLDRDHTFDLLFSERRRSHDREQGAQARRELAIQELAVAWSKRQPTEVVVELQRLSSEAPFLGPGHEDLTRRLCTNLAEIVERPEVWLQALFDAPVWAALLEPFLARCVRERRPGWEGWLGRCFESENLHWAALQQLLTMAHPDESLVARAIAAAGPFAQLVETLCSNRRVPLPQLRALLRSEDARVSLAAAAGEWDAVPEHVIRPELSEEWRSAILRIDSDKVWSFRSVAMLEFWFGEILSHDTELATEWLCARLGSEDSGALSDHGPAGQAIRALSPDQRVVVLAAARADRLHGNLVRELVNGDVVVYRRLLHIRHLATFHLEPLHGVPDEAWKTLARAALEAGFSPDQIARASLSEPHTIASQAEIAHWERFKEAFGALSSSDTPELQEVGRAGIDASEERIARARRSIRALQISGF